MIFTFIFHLLLSEKNNIFKLNIKLNIRVKCKGMIFLENLLVSFRNLLTS